MPDAGWGNNGQRYEPGPDIFHSDMQVFLISMYLGATSEPALCSMGPVLESNAECKLLNNLLPMLHERRQWKRIELEAGNTPKAARHCQGSGCSRGTMHWMPWIPVRDAVLQNVKMWIALIAPQSWNLSWPSLKPAIRSYLILWKDFSIGFDSENEIKITMPLVLSKCWVFSVK